MDLGQASGSGLNKGFKPGLDIRAYDDDDLDRLEQVTNLCSSDFIECCVEIVILFELSNPHSSVFLI